MLWTVFKKAPKMSYVMDMCPLLWVLPDNSTTVTKDGHYVRVAELQGRDYTGISSDMDESLYELRKQFFEDVGPYLDVTLISYRHRLSRDVDRLTHGNPVTDAIAHRWAENFKSSYRTRHFLATRTASGAVVDRMLAKAERSFREESDAERMTRLDDFTSHLSRKLQEYRPHVLKGNELATYWAWLINGRLTNKALPANRIFDDLLVESELLWPNDEPYQVYRHDRDLYSAWFTIRLYPYETGSKLLDPLFKVKREFTMVQNFSIMGKEKALAVLNDKIRFNAGFTAASDIILEELNELINRVQADEIKICQHAFSLQVFADSPQELNAAVEEIRYALEQRFITAKRERKLQEPLFWSQFPGLERLNVRRREITTENLAKFCNFATIGEGLDSCSWGPMPVATFKTEAGSEYSFTFHDSTEDKALGHTLVVGAPGQGKTTLVSFLISNALKYPGMRVLAFDRLHGMDIAIRMQDGAYIDFMDAPYINPLQLRDMPSNRAFLADWFELITGKTDDHSRALVSRAIDMLYTLKRDDRTLEAISDAFGLKQADSIRNALEKWLPEGAYGHYFTARTDALDFRARLIGFDMTAVLDLPQVLGPLTRYLFHRLESMILEDPAPFLIFVDEFRSYLNSPGFSEKIIKAAQEYRKLDGVLVAAMQNASHFFESEAGAKMKSMFATYILFPDANADKEFYGEDGFGLSDEEFAWIKEPHQRQAMIKRRESGESAIIEIDLSTLREYLKVYNSSVNAVAHINKLRKKYPDWRERYINGQE